MNNKRVIAIVGAVLLVVAVVFGISILIGGDDAEAPTEADSAASVAGSDDVSADDGEVAQTRPVEVTGDLLAPFESPDGDEAVGSPAPVVSGADFGGESVTLGEATGSPQMYVFLAHWCPHCNAEIPELLAADDAAGMPDDLRVVGISTASAADRPNYPPSEWLDEMGWRWESMADSEAAEALIAYGGTSFPFTVIVDGDGTVVARKAGESSADDIADWIATNTS